MLNTALQYAESGWPVFPCSAKNKQPLTHDGLYSATTDTEVITRWWMRWPDAMIGLPTGDAIGAFVVDLDPKYGVSVDTLMSQIEAAIGHSLPDTATVSTPRGGRHLYIAMPDADIRNRQNVIPHVDVRGNGGYVIAAGSVTEARKSYERVNDADPAEPTDAIVQFVVSDRPASQGTRRAQKQRKQPMTKAERMRRYRANDEMALVQTRVPPEYRDELLAFAKSLRERS